MQAYIEKEKRLNTVMLYQSQLFDQIQRSIHSKLVAYKLIQIVFTFEIHLLIVSSILLFQTYFL